MMPRRDITVYQPISANLCKRAHTGHPFFLFSQFVAIRLKRNVVQLLKNFLFNVYGRFVTSSFIRVSFCKLQYEENGREINFWICTSSSKFLREDFINNLIINPVLEIFYFSLCLLLLVVKPKLFVQINKGRIQKCNCCYEFFSILFQRMNLHYELEKLSIKVNHFPSISQTNWSCFLSRIQDLIGNDCVPLTKISRGETNIDQSDTLCKKVLYIPMYTTEGK